MSDLPLPGFPAHAAYRSIYLGQIWQQVDKDAVANLVAAQGIDRGSFWLYWDTRRPNSGAYHRGDCWVEFRTRQLAVLAWARLDGMFKWGRSLVVRPVNKPGALNPSANELNAVLQPPPSSSGPPPPQAPSAPSQAPPQPHRAPSPSVAPKNEPSDDRWADLEASYPNAIKMLRSQSTDNHNTADPPTGAAPTNAKDASPAPAPGPSSSEPEDDDIWSDPSLLETIRRNATKIGLGWGGYGPFQADPFLRTIDPCDVLMLNWHASSPNKPIRFCNGEGEVTFEVPRFVDQEAEEEERTEALWFLLAQASDEWSDEELREMERSLPLPGDVGL